MLPLREVALMNGMSLEFSAAPFFPNHLKMDGKGCGLFVGGFSEFWMEG